MPKKLMSGLLHFAKDENGDAMQLIAGAALGVLGLWIIWRVAQPRIQGFTTDYTNNIIKDPTSYGSSNS